MGRKPNQLILEFFERGPKLDDQSNRYEHTCKRCKMLFPKGRPDTMNRHLFEQCPKISELDKARAFACAQGQMDPEAIAKRFGDNPGAQQFTGVTPFRHLAPSQGDSVTASLNREPSALDTLAEVSRQHMDLSRQRLHAETINGEQEQGLEEAEWMLSLQQQLSEANNADRPLDQSLSDSGVLIDAANAASNIDASSQHNGQDETARLERQRKRKRTLNLDPALHNEETSPPAGQEIVEIEDDGDDASNAYRTAGSNGYGVLGRAERKKGRTKFSTERRKEVDGIRKLGACLRCKMLKKPCSGETPCLTCKSIGSPRLWHTACIRTRIADEFTLYNAAFFSARAAQHDSLVCLMVDTELTVGICDGPTLSTLIAEVNHNGNLSWPPPRNVHLVFRICRDRIWDSMQLLLMNAKEHVLQGETNQFVRASIEALQLDAGEDLLATRTVLLYIATALLLNPFTLFVFSLSSIHGQQFIDPGEPCYSVVTSQLFAQFESYASQIFKQICNELERRLLARASTSSNSTFLIAVILLSCVERICLFYRTFDPRRVTLSTSSDDPTNMNDPSGVPRNWDLPHPPQLYYTQGQPFANLLVMLLKMRNLPPKIDINPGSPQGISVTVQQGRHRLVVPPSMEDLAGTTLGHIDDRDAALRRIAVWLADTGVGLSDLLTAEAKNDDDLVGGPDAQNALYNVDQDASAHAADNIDAHLNDTSAREEGHGSHEGPQTGVEQSLEDQHRHIDWRAWDLRFTAGLLLPDER